LVPLFQGFGKEIEIIVDGGYAKDTVLGVPSIDKFQQKPEWSAAQ